MADFNRYAGNSDPLEDERPVPKWPYLVGALLLLAIPIVAIVIFVTVF